MNEITFNSDIKELSTNINKNIYVLDQTLTLSLNAYNNKDTIDVLKKWQSCFALLGKGQLLQSKDASTIIYCLLSDALSIDMINYAKVNIDLYDPILNRFYLVESLTKKHRNIRLKVFPICNTMIVFDWSLYPIYKIYELYNTDQVKEYYESKKVNFDKIVKDLGLVPKFIGKVDSLDNLYTYFKKLSVNNLEDYKEKHIKVLEDFLRKYRVLEKQIQSEYKKYFKKPCIKVY